MVFFGRSDDPYGYMGGAGKEKALPYFGCKKKVFFSA